MVLEGIVEDWERVKKRWQEWWEGQLYDRVLIGITAPRDGVTAAVSPEVDPEIQWTDIDYMIQRMRETIRTTYYAGEAVPIFWHNWSAGHTLYFGCQPHFKGDTVWVEPAPVGQDGLPILEGWRDNPWWHWMLEGTEAAARASNGQYFVMPLWGNGAGDNLALIRGTEQLLMDIALNPDWVRSTVKTLSDIQIEVYEALWPLVSADLTGLEGSISYVGSWSPARTLGLDCDISCMVSPESFKDLFLFPLIETMRTVEHNVYHLDGPGAIKHLDVLLELPELHAIQWVPGAGQEAIMQWAPLIRRIQSKGKGVAVSIQPDELEPLLREVRAEGLWIQTSCATQAEAKELLGLAARLSGQRHK